MLKFEARLEIIGVNPFVFLPPEILEDIFRQAGKDRGPIPVKGILNGKPYRQTLMKFRSEWRFYVNTFMLKDSPKRIGEWLVIEIEFDPEDRRTRPHPAFLKALSENRDAQASFASLSPSRQNEILRYIASLKSEESRDRNIKRAIGFLTGKNGFAGREKPGKV